MALLEAATAYIFNTINQSENDKKNSKDFEWVFSWFLADDPVTKMILENEEQPEDVRKTVLNTKLKILQQNPQFQKELAQKLAVYTPSKTYSKNVVDNSNITVAGHIHIGDTNNPQKETYTEKNTVKNSHIKAGGNFHLGDSNKPSPNKAILPQEKSRPQPDNFKKTLQQFISNNDLKKAIDILMEFTEKHQEHRIDEVVLLSNRYQNYARKNRSGTLANTDTNIERTQIADDLLKIIEVIVP